MTEAPERPDEQPDAPEPPDAGEPEVPDTPLGVPADADDDDAQPPGFQRDAPNAG
jgi:hypothetical protein